MCACASRGRRRPGKRARGIEPPFLAWEASVLTIGQRPRGSPESNARGIRWGVVRRALVIVLLLAFAAPAQAAEPKTTLPDVEDEVMCVECGTALNVSTSPVAERERELIRRMVAEGRTKAQIKAALVDSYGKDVLAQPSDSGIGLAAWWVPVVLAPLGLLVA